MSTRELTKNREKTMNCARWLALLGSVVVAGACAKSVGDIRRVQPDYYAKSIFTGTWYSRPTVISAAYNQASLFEGLEGNMEKVRWEVQEEQLVAWRAYENIPNSEENPGSHTPIAIFRIKKQFDLRRDYNAANGAEGNVIVENDFDRPWWERDYIRVDWSANLVPDYDLAGFAKFSGESMAINQTGDKYEVERPRITEDYIDVVNRVHMFPDWSILAMYGWEGDLFKDTEATIRWSFRKVEERGFEPLLYPDYLPVKVKYRYARRLNATTYLPCTPTRDDRSCVLYGGAPSSGPSDGTCGSYSETVTPNWNNTALCHPDTTLQQDCFCTSEAVDLWLDSSGNICDSRLGADIDPEDCYQLTYPVFERFGFFRTLRFPFDWERNFTFQGRIYLANRWHIWDRSKGEDGAAIPYADRVPKPVVYYTNPEFPEDLREDADHIASDWSRPLKDTVAELQGVAVGSVPEMFQVRRNNCNPENVLEFAARNDMEWVLDDAIGGKDRLAPGNLKRACTALEVETWERDGDERFEWQRVGDLRYSFMHWVHTPQLAGPLGYGPSSADPETGEIVSANAYLYGAAVDTYANFAADVIQLVNGELDPAQFADGDYTISEIALGRARVNQGLSKRSARQLMQRVADLDAADPEGYMPQLPSPSDINRADPRSATALMDQNMRIKAMDGFAREYLVDEEMLKAFAGPDRYQPGALPGMDALKHASPARWGRYPDLLAQLKASDPRADSEDDTLGGLDRHARLERYLAEKTIEYGSMLVEPAIYGLAQDFRGLPRDEVVRRARKKIFYGVEAHEVGHTLGLRHNFAGSSDAMNFHEQFWSELDPATDPTSRKWDYAYSSIMDYHQRFSSDWAGVGPYDRAAVKFGYGQLMEVFDERGGNFVPRTYFDFATSVMDYTDIPRILSGTNVDQAFETAYYDALAGRSQVLTLPASIPPSVDNQYKRRNVPFADVWKDYINDNLPGFVNGVYSPGYENEYVPVPYQFCSDAYAWGGNLTCNRYDMGANIQEIVHHSAEMYDSYYLFNNFRRDRFFFMGGPMTFDVGAYMERLYSRTYQPMLNAFRYYFYYRRSQLIMYPLVQDWATAAFEGLNFFSSVIAKPNPGKYCLKLGTYVPRSESPGTCDSPVEIPLGQGRQFSSGWTGEYYYKPTVVGSYWDKALALQALTDSQFFLVRNFSSLFDRGAFSITYYRVFEDEITNLFRSLTEGSLGDMSSGVQQDAATGEWTVVPRPLVGLEGHTAPNLPRIKAASNWSLQKLSAFFGMLGFTSTVDRKMDFARRMRVTYQGASDDPLYEGFTAAEIATFTDPVTHLVYRAAPVGGLDAPGYRMVEQARQFHDQTWVPAKAEYDQAQAALDALIASGNASAQQLNAATEARDNAMVGFSAADRALREKVELLEYVRVLGWYQHLYAD
ncbi:MAG: zinc-dependent metalloprotease [Deltaproteobacteria bacterium]|nr:zinc-dependent metalloprotease [Deltaproteobacteria bacterium]